MSNLPAFTSCRIPSTDMVALGSGLPSTSLTIPLIPRCTCQENILLSLSDLNNRLLFLIILKSDWGIFSFSVCVQLLELRLNQPSTNPLQPYSGDLKTESHIKTISLVLTCSMKDRSDSRLFSHSRGSSLSCGNLSQPKKMDSSKQFVCR